MKTKQVTIQNHTRLLDAEMVDKLIHTEIKVTAEKGMYEEICVLFRLVAPLDEYRPVANTGNYIVRAGYWSQDDMSDLPAYPISSFFVDEVPAVVVPETPDKDAAKLSHEEMRAPIENALYATKRFLTTQATELAEDILSYLKEAGYVIEHKPFIKPVN